MGRVLVHLSDLHFGRTDPLLVDALAGKIAEVHPDLLVVTGDLTQRARTAEFREARAFLDRLPYPRIVVPGNHDVPLYNVYGRFVRRLDRFLSYITPDLQPSYVDEEVAVLGANTARWFVWKGGALNQEQVFRLHEALCALPGELVKIVATHHPFDLPEGFADRNLLRGARRYFGRMMECGADILLCGHLHVAHARSSIERYAMLDRAALVVHAGTATSTRLRGEPNSFNVLRIGNGRVRIDEVTWSLAESAFQERRSTVFEKTAGGWALAA